MDKLVIRGGKRLKGEVVISGAKNAALPLMASSLLCRGTHTLLNVPNLRDIDTMVKLLAHLGVQATTTADGLALVTNDIRDDDAPYEMVRTMRASVLVMGPLVARLKHAKVSLPGGCAIGARPIDLHLKALTQMGAGVDLHDGYVEIRTPALRGARIVFDIVTVTGTENIMMAATLAKGETILENAAREPEVVDLARHLVAMGANIGGIGTDRLVITGVDELSPSVHTVPADRIETGTYAIAAAITGGEVILRQCPTDALDALFAKLKEAGCSITIDGKVVHIQGSNHIASVDITTAPYPGFPTDLQAQFMALMTKADGTSIISETIFENRFMHVSELQRMGADITVEHATAVVKGVPVLRGAPVMATDLRASASLVLAALAAEGTTEVRRLYHLDRGYERIEEKLSRLGADITRASDDA